MSYPQRVPATTGRWKRPVYLLVVVAALGMVMLVWFHTPQVRVESDTAAQGYVTIRCANAGPSRWEPPTASRGQDLSPAEQVNWQILKNDLDALRVGLACEQARDGHTNTLIVATFAAGAVLFFGHSALWSRRSRPELLTAPR